MLVSRRATYLKKMRLNEAWTFFIAHQLIASLAVNRPFRCQAFIAAPKKSTFKDLHSETRHLFSSGLNEVLNTESLLSKDERDRLSTLVGRRADARARGDYATADSIKNEIYRSVSLPQDVVLQIHDVPRRDGGGSTWKLVRDATLMEGQTVLQLAHAALGIAVASSKGRPHSTRDVDFLVKQAKERLDKRELVEFELKGRKAADASFWFALAGVTDPDLFDALTEISGKELRRYGTRPSCRAKDIWHVLERLAAAGVQSDKTVEQAAATALQSKHNRASNGQNATSLLDFHSDRCLLMIWKFSTRQRKQRAFLQSAVNHWEKQASQRVIASQSSDIAQANDTIDNAFTTGREQEWFDLFTNPRLPLVVDVGCGMAVSLLGLAQCKSDEYSDANFAGVDLSGLSIGYANGLSRRWGLGGRLQFFVDNAESFVKRVLDSYPGPVRLCLIQFPTPYRLKLPRNGINKDKASIHQKGNSQLPVDGTSGFMVTRRLLELIHAVLSRGEPGASLLIQSNCEDVAVYMRRMACEKVGYECVQFGDEEPPLEAPGALVTRTPKRTIDWISRGGERAEGEGWTTQPILPRIGRTETEVACMMNGTPVHRCLLRVRVPP